MSDKIIVKFNETPKLIVKLNDEYKISVKFNKQGIKGDTGATGTTGGCGPAGTSDHALLSNLDYDNSGHTNFQKKLNYITEYKAYEIV